MPPQPHRDYGPAEGPLGFPMTDKQAFAVEAVLKALPRERAFDYRRVALEKATTELLPSERSDVSWITTEDPDRSNEVVISRGMNDGQYQLNPLVTMQHAYWLPPVGKSLWRKRTKDGNRRGIKAKTVYPNRPVDWPAHGDWPPDAAFSLVQNDLLRGKSIGFLPVKVHAPSETEITANGWRTVSLVIDEWLLLEYACCYLPCQQHAVVEAVSKSLPNPALALKAVGLTPPLPPPVIGFTTFEEIEKAVIRRVEAIDFAGMAAALAVEYLDRLRGRV